MTEKSAANTASVLARLRNVARQKQTDFQLILRRYAVERLLHRLSLSSERDRYVLKGAMLFTAWLNDPFRPTQDLDLAGFGDPSLASIAASFKTICAVKLEDGLSFDTETFRIDPIREDQQYGGVRLRMTATLGRTRIPVQVDIGFGDAMTPDAEVLTFPPLLTTEGPTLRAYPKETVVAEKLQAIVSLGRANSRMKDFYDLVAISRLFPFEGDILAEAIAATFERRETQIPVTKPDGLSNDFAVDRDKQRQWTAFLDRELLLISEVELSVAISEITDFVWPVIEALQSGTSFKRVWAASGPWR